jgi:hypothetical protein
MDLFTKFKETLVKAVGALRKPGDPSLELLKALDAAKNPRSEELLKALTPTKGYKGKTKKSYRAGGEAGYRGEAINELVKRMI